MLATPVWTSTTNSLQMDADSDNDAGFGVGRRHSSSSSRESSPVRKRPRRSISPTSDDGDLLNPVAHNEDAETPTPENTLLIRQAVGFSSLNAHVNTYQATVAPQPTVSYFLPGQAPPAPPKPKVTKPRAPRKKKGEQYSDRTSKFKLVSMSGFMAPASSALVNSIPASVTAHTSARPMIPVANYASNHTSENANAPGTSTSVAAPMVTGRTSDTSRRKRPAPVNEPFNQPSTRSPAQVPATSTYTTSQHHHSGEPSAERPGRAPEPHATHSTSPGVTPGGTSVEQSNPSTAVTQTPPQNPVRPLRMLTLLIEDLRSGVPDPQLAEVRVPLKVADDPEDGFWADAVEVCNLLQAGPSRVDGPAKVYTTRGRFRQFFMRVDQYDQFQVQPAHLSVSKERTLSVFVESPVPQGHLPRPPFQPSNARRNSISEHSSASAPFSRPTYSLVTREEQIERLSKSNYARPDRGRRSPLSEGGLYDHSQRTSPHTRHRSSRRDQDAGSSQRPLSPPIPGRMADTQEEKDEAIANYIRAHIENHTDWMDYMQSKAKPQRVSEVLKQYNFVEDRVRELGGLRTPVHWDGAPNCLVERHHVWRVLKLDDEWCEECEETLDLVGYYGEGGSRYEDSRVVDMINDTSPPRANAMQKFLRLLRDADENFMQDAVSGELPPSVAQP